MGRPVADEDRGGSTFPETTPVTDEPRHGSTEEPKTGLPSHDEEDADDSQELLQAHPT